MLKTIATMEPQKVGELAGHATASASSGNSSTSLVESPVSCWDQEMTCSHRKASFLRKGGCRDRRNLRDYVRVFLRPKCYRVAETETVRSD